MGVPYACLACRPPAVAVSEKILAIWGIALCSRSSKSDSSERPAQTLAAWQLASQMTSRRALSFNSLRQRLRREPKLKQAASLLCSLRLGSPACDRRRPMVVSRGRSVGSCLLRLHHRFFQEQTQVLAPAKQKKGRGAESSDATRGHNGAHSQRQFGRGIPRG